MSNKIVITVALIVFGLSCNASPIMSPDIGGLNNSINESNYINEKMNEYTMLDKKNSTQETTPIKYNFHKGDVDVSQQQGVEIPGSGNINSSKTIYTDGLGRLHFFGKGSTVRE